MTLSSIYLKVSSYPLKENGELKAAAILFEDITKEQTMFEEVINKFDEIKEYLMKVIKIDENKYKIEAPLKLTKYERAY